MNQCLLYSDSMLKYFKASSTTMMAFGGETVSYLCNHLHFKEIKAKGFTKIMIYVGMDDLSTLIDNAQHVSIHELLWIFKVLRDVIRKIKKQLFYSVQFCWEFVVLNCFAILFTVWNLPLWRNGVPNQMNLQFSFHFFILCWRAFLMGNILHGVVFI